MLKNSHSASALAGSSLGLERPVVSAGLSTRWKAGSSTSLLLLVPVLLATVARQGMSLLSSFSLSLSSLGLNTSK